MTASPVQPASAAMPSEGEIDRIVTGLYRRFKDWSKRGFSADDVTWCEVKADVLALFAPILAEKERVEREWTSEKERADMAAAQMVKQNDRVRELVALLDKQMGTPCEQIRHRQQIYEERETNALALSCWQDAARALEAERDALKARALAAEAALAAERERFEAMVRAYEARSLEDERSRLEAAAPLSARETARYLEIDQKLAGLNAAAIRAQGE